MDRNVTLSYNTSTLEGSILTLSQTCENDISNSTERRILRLNVTCHSSGNWIPDPAQFTCSPSTTVPPGTEILTHSTPNSSGSKYLSYYLLLHAMYIIMILKQTIILIFGTYASFRYSHTQ